MVVAHGNGPGPKHQRAQDVINHATEVVIHPGRVEPFGNKIGVSLKGHMRVQAIRVPAATAGIRRIRIVIEVSENDPVRLLNFISAYAALRPCSRGTIAMM